MESLTILRDTIKACTRCELHSLHHGPVPPRWGTSEAPRVFVVGEAPGENEDKEGKPFIGRSGVMLAEWLAVVGIESAFVTNVVKCRPSNNADPRPPWIEACAVHLAAELKAVQPRLIVCIGRYAGNTILGRRSTMGMLASLNDRATRDIPGGEPAAVVSVYHPAAFMYGCKVWTIEKNLEAIRAGMVRAGLVPRA